MTRGAVDVLADYAAITEYLATHGLRPVRDTPEWRLDEGGCSVRVLLVTTTYTGDPWRAFDVLVHTAHNHVGQQGSARGYPWTAGSASLPEAVREAFAALRKTMGCVYGQATPTDA